MPDISKTSTDEEILRFYNAVVPYLDKGGTILDFGCGPGRDSLYFSSLGFNVVSSDDSPKMCEVAMKRGCKNVKCEGFMDLNAVDDYNMVWAMSSLALAQPESLPLIISKVYTALKPKGIFFMNLRYENEEPLKGLLGRADLFQVLDLWGCKDSRTGRDVHWQNAVLRRK